MARKKSKGGLEGIINGFAELVDKLGALAEKGEQLSRTGELKFNQKGEGIKGVYGFSIKTGIGGDPVTVEPFGNIRRDEDTGEAVVQEIREPVADIFEEKDCTIIVVEMPGISEEDVQIDVRDDLLTLYAEKGEKKFRKEILMPKSYLREKMQISCNNGILEIKCT
ncbi:MAG: Hsp20/alpha crystallin family protein [Desulfobacteraceae bacterium]|nr:Hsp20/alpha crystallin family protein [Desulfobacteraceae bacterium]MCF8050325.1 Hsp20/alpha crystallin family protein [Desulfobacterales bacterium]MCF8080960.1 Hsp20/alpha crystallin family protein [Desulfobacterales bacterium]